MWVKIKLHLKKQPLKLKTEQLLPSERRRITLSLAPNTGEQECNESSGYSKPGGNWSKWTCANNAPSHNTAHERTPSSSKLHDVSWKKTEREQKRRDLINSHNPVPDESILLKTMTPDP